MKYSLSNLLLLTALTAALLAWFLDHWRLANDYERLNLESANLISRIAALRGSGRVLLPGEKVITRTYNFSIEKDRADYLTDLLLPYDSAVPYDMGTRDSDSKH